MSRIFLIDNEISRDILAQQLADKFDTYVICFSTAEEAIGMLRNEILRPIVITRSEIWGQKTAERIYEYLSGVKEQSSLIIMGETPMLKFVVPCLPEPIKIDELMVEVGRRLVPIIPAEDREFLPIKLSFIETLGETPCDIYIRIKQGEQYLFVKIINKFDHIDQDKFNYYKSKKLEIVYTTTEVRDVFFAALNKQFVSVLDDNTVDVESKIQTAAGAYEVLRAMINEFQMVEHCKILTEASIRSIKSSVQSSPKTAQLLSHLLKNDLNFAYKQCHLRVVICHHVLTKQSWYKEQHLDVFTFASFFSDITLETPEEMLISRFDELDRGLPEERRLKIIFHPKEAIEIAEKFKGYNDLVKVVIMQSNGNSDGFAFEDSPGEDLHILSKIFIIADEFVRLLLNPNFSSMKKDILEALSVRYPQPSYQKIIKTLEQKFN